MNILVLDDDKAVLASMRIQLQNRFPAQYHFSYCGDYATYKAELSGKSFDVLLLDILLPEQNGIEIATQITAEHPDAAVIYFTGYPLEYCEAIFEGVKPFGYLKKPINYDKLQSMLQDIESRKTVLPQYFIKVHGSQIALRQDKTIWLESHGRTVTIYCVDRHYVVYAKLGDLEQQLPTFIRCHASYLVNPIFIRSLEQTRFSVEHRETEIPISRKYLKQARTRFFEMKGDLYG